MSEVISVNWQGKEIKLNGIVVGGGDGDGVKGK